MKHWTHWNREDDKKEFGTYKCPLLEKVSNGRITTIDIIMCDHDLECTGCSDSRENCEETFLICANCNSNDNAQLSNLNNYNFKFKILVEAWKHREKSIKKRRKKK